MEKIKMNTAVRDSVLCNAPLRKCITTSCDGMDKNTMQEWKKHTAALVAAVEKYVSVMQENNVATLATRDIIPAADTMEQAKKDAVSAVYAALAAVREFGGFTFPNGHDEPELLAIRLTSTKVEKDAAGKAESVFDCIKSESTARREIEWYLYARQVGKIGKTAEQYAAEKAAAKEAKKAADKAKRAAAKAKAKEEADAAAKIAAEKAEQERKARAAEKADAARREARTAAGLPETKEEAAA